jgi:hypothetical protein
LSRVSGESSANLIDPWKVDAQDWGEGELLFTWRHDMDFMLERDASEERVIDLVMARLRLSVKDSLSQVSVEVPIPEDWYRS